MKHPMACIYYVVLMTLQRIATKSIQLNAGILHIELGFVFVTHNKNCMQYVKIFKNIPYM